MCLLLIWRRESNPQYAGSLKSVPRYHIAIINQCFSCKNTLFLISKYFLIIFFASPFLHPIPHCREEQNVRVADKQQRVGGVRVHRIGNSAVD